jgi:hypothetical protein
MTRPTKLEVNCETGVETIVELTDDEMAQAELDAIAWAEEKTQKDAAIAAELAAKASAEAKLTALGLTAEEIAAFIK